MRSPDREQPQTRRNAVRDMPEGKEQPVKEALREYGRTVAIFAAAGLVLSLLVGLLARNPFGTMLLRAVLLAIAFGGVGAGMQYVVRRFLPGIAAGEPAGSGDPDAAAAPAAGSTIDIVLPEEPVPAEAGSEAGGEPLEELPTTGDGAADAVVEEFESAEPPKSAEAAAPVTGDLDALPEFGRAEPTAAAPRGAARAPGSRTRPSDATREVLERHDPAALARGLRTMLKRDERS